MALTDTRGHGGGRGNRASFNKKLYFLLYLKNYKL